MLGFIALNALAGRGMPNGRGGEYTFVEAALGTTVGIVYAGVMYALVNVLGHALLPVFEWLIR